MAKNQTNPEEAKNKEQKKAAPKKDRKTVQSLMPYVQCYEDGIIKNANNEYSKMYKLADANFITEPESKQEDILLQYQKLLNKFQENVSMAIVIINKQMTNENLAHMYHIREKGVKQDVYANDYNKIIDDKIKEGRNDIRKEKYIILTVNTNSYDAAPFYPPVTYENKVFLLPLYDKCVYVYDDQTKKIEKSERLSEYTAESYIEKELCVHSFAPRIVGKKLKFICGRDAKWICFEIENEEINSFNVTDDCDYEAVKMDHMELCFRKDGVMREGEMTFEDLLGYLAPGK